MFLKTVLDTKQFISAMQQIAEEKGIPQDKVVETIEAAIAAAYKKDYGEKGQVIRAKLHEETGDFTITQVKYVVEGVDENECVIGDVSKLGLVKDEHEERGGHNPFRKEQQQAEQAPVQAEVKEGEVASGEEVIDENCVKFNPDKFVTLEDAKAIDSALQVGDELIIPLEAKMEFGRIAAQTAKQVIIQRLREVERDVIFSEFKHKEGEVTSGAIQRIEGRMIYIDLGRANGVLPPMEQLPTDNYRIGQRLRFLIVRVEETNKGPAIVLSRAHPNLVMKLFEFEVPEIESGTVQIKSIAREAGSRSKVAVTSSENGVDPIGSLVGQKGVRVQTVINELGGEKIDIIEWSEDPVKFITNALSPAKILQVKVLDEKYRHALAEVADDQFSLAIGKNGQNVRLAAKLTGWKIDVRAPQAVMSADEAGENIQPAAEVAEAIAEATNTEPVQVEEPAVLEEANPTE